MIKLVYSIVDERYNLIGFGCRGKERDFNITGGESIVIRPVTIASMAGNGFSNNQIKVKANGMVEEIGYFRIHDLPMKMFTQNNLIDTDNSLEIKAAVKINGAIGGYDMVVCGKTMRIDTKSIIRVSRYMKPKNFQVRQKEDGSCFIAGANGVKLGDLPVVDLDKPKSTVVKGGAKGVPAKVNSEGVAVKEPTMEKLGPQVGLIDLYTAIQSHNGEVVLLPNTEYKNTTNGGTTYGSGFVPMNIGEIGRLNHNGFTFNKKELNASVTFKKPGIVTLPSNAAITCHTISNKKLINNGKNHIKHIGISLHSQDAVKAIQGLVGDPARLNTVNDQKTVSTFTALSGNGVTSILDCDISDMPVVLPRNYDGYIKGIDDLYKLVVNLTGFEIANKYIRQGTGLCNELKKLIGSAEAAKAVGRTIYSGYSSFSPELIKEMAENGIDVFTGTYTVTEKKEYDASKAGEGTPEAIVGIKYYLKGYDPDKWSFAKIKAEYGKGDSCQLPGRYLVESIMNFQGTDVEKYVAAMELAEKIESYVEALRKELWLHKYCMCMEFNGKVHQNDKDFWVDAPTKKKSGNLYECKNHNGFMLEVDNTSI
jgi:hypothetical protein